jgi:hypothetical protein
MIIISGSTSHGPKVVTDGLVLCLDAANTKSYPGSGEIWKDINNYGYNGTLVNGPTFSTEGKGCIVFDGVDDYLVRSDASLQTYTTITANIWMYVLSSTDFQTYFSYKADQGGLTAGWGVRRWQIADTNNTYQYWGGTGNSGIKLYKNGTLIASTNSNFGLAYGYDIINSWCLVTLVATNVSSWFPNSSNFTLGIRSDILSDSVKTNYKVGYFSLYNRELSSTEVLQNYNALKARYGL